MKNWKKKEKKYEKFRNDGGDKLKLEIDLPDIPDKYRGVVVGITKEVLKQIMPSIKKQLKNIRMDSDTS